jgi:hypothetical protein
MRCVGNCFWHPQEQELLYHISTVSSACTFWRSTCRAMKLSCHIHSLIHSFSSLSHERSNASSKVSSPHNAI